MSRQLKQLRKELNQIYFMLNFTMNPIEFETLLQRSTQLEKQITQLQRHEQYDISGQEICKKED